MPSCTVPVGAVVCAHLKKRVGGAALLGAILDAVFVVGEIVHAVN